MNSKLVSTASTLSSSAFDKGDKVYVSVVPTDGTDDGAAVKSGTATVANTLPELTSLSLSPTNPRTTHLITASTATKDADGDTVSISHAWYVNSTKVSYTGASLPTSFTKKHDKVYVVATPNDGDGDGPSKTSGTLTVQNTPPLITSVTLTPASFGEADTVTCNPVGWSDPDGDTAIYRYAWKLNGATITHSRQDHHAVSIFDKGDTVQCIVTPNDGEDNGTPVGSAVVTVGNSLPVLASATITPGAPKEADTMSVTLGAATDADGDRISFKYAWYVNSSKVSTASTLKGVSFDKGDKVYVVVTPNDGIADGSPVTSATVTVANTAPVISSVALSPKSPGTDTTVTAAVAASDIDGDSMTYSYVWYVNGSKVSATGPSLDGKTYFGKGDTIYVIATANDGDDDSASVKSATLTQWATARRASRR